MLFIAHLLALLSANNWTYFDHNNYRSLDISELKDATAYGARRFACWVLLASKGLAVFCMKLAEDQSRIV